jgi:predicted nucleic acid-binding protein
MDDPNGQPEQYRRCQALLLSLSLPLVTTWPCLAEAIHLTGREGGWPMQLVLVRMLRTNSLRLHDLSAAETARALDMMEQYRDLPMDLADASLVALAETQGYTRVFSLDSDFYVYRLADGRALEVVPGPLPRPPQH